jgi:FMN phosphatase YigB (HAD superfamily)
VDIDGTLTQIDAEPRLPESGLVWGNPVFGVICDVMSESGYLRDEARRRIEEYADRIVWWDYMGVIREFGVPEDKAVERIREWHNENLSVFSDTVRTVKALHEMGKKLFIVSNNPASGCIFKLERSGLAEGGSSGYFTHIFGTDTLKGQKFQPEAWSVVASSLEVEPRRVFTIGDNEKEDGDLPIASGFGGAFIIKRDMGESVAVDGAKVFVKDPGSIAELVRG